MKVIITTTALLLVAACTTPAPICDRGAQEWSKFGTQEDVCVTPPSVVVAQPIDWPHDDDDKDRTERPTDVTTPTLPQDPTSPPVTPPSGPVTPPSGPETPPSNPETPPSDDDDGKKDKPKGDNSDANGKGGNKHDRDDFTHGGTEVAEDKKND